MTFFQRRYWNGGQIHENVVNTINHQEKANKKTQDITSHQLGWLLSKRKEKTNTGEDVDKREHLW